MAGAAFDIVDPGPTQWRKRRKGRGSPYLGWYSHPSVPVLASASAWGWIAC